MPDPLYIYIYIYIYIKCIICKHILLIIFLHTCSIVTTLIHIQLYTYTCGNMVNTTMTNEHTSLEKYTSHTLFEMVMCERWVGDWTNCNCCIIFCWFMQKYTNIYWIHTDAMIKTQEDFFINICTSHFIVRVRKGYPRFYGERELETEHKL